MSAMERWGREALIDLLLLMKVVGRMCTCCQSPPPPPGCYRGPGKYMGGLKLVSLASSLSSVRTSYGAALWLDVLLQG